MSVPMFVYPRRFGDGYNILVHLNCSCMGQMAENGYCGFQIGQKHLHKHPKWFRFTLEKTSFLNLFGPYFGPEMAHFQASLGHLGAKTGNHGLKTGEKYLFEN